MKLWKTLPWVNKCTYVQISAKVGARGLKNFIPAVAYHFCLNLLAAFTQPGVPTLADLCRSEPTPPELVPRAEDGKSYSVTDLVRLLNFGDRFGEICVNITKLTQAHSVISASKVLGKRQQHKGAVFLRTK